MQIFFFFYFSHFFRPDVRNHDTLALASKDKQNTFVVNNWSSIFDFSFFYVVYYLHTKQEQQTKNIDNKIVFQINKKQNKTGREKKRKRETNADGGVFYR